MHSLEKRLPVAACVAVALCASSGRAQSADSWKFDFGTGPVAPGFRAVTPETRYTAETGFGFEPEAQVEANVGKGAKATSPTGCSSQTPFRFSAAVPQGFYDVTVTLGNPTAASATTLKAEARRLILQNVVTTPGQMETRSFTVAVKRPLFASGQAMRLKPQDPANWDEKLTLEFNGAHPSVCALEIAPAKAPVAVFIAGDSTVTDQAGEPYTGWGQMLPRFFKQGAVVWNEAQSGESLSSFEHAGLLKKILEMSRPGDYLFIQFGHNDQKDKAPGAGPFTSYKTNLKHYVEEARNHKLNPVLVTSMERRNFQDGVFSPSLAQYAEAVRQTGQEEGVPVIDLNAASIKFYNALGPEKSKTAFVQYAANTYPNQPQPLKDNTHHNSYGAYELARVVACGIRDDKLDLAKFLVDDLTTFDPSQPDDAATLVLPSSPAHPTAKPDGN